MVAEDLFLSGHKRNDSWNFGPNVTDIRTVSEIAKLFSSHWGVDNIIEDENSENHHEAKSLSLDSSKAFFGLNWHPVWNVEKAILETAEWYKVLQNNDDVFTKTNKQIEEYISNFKS